jgi:hypothetical protein
MCFISYSAQDFVFAFSWLGGFCDGGCLESKYKLWDQYLTFYSANPFLFMGYGLKIDTNLESLEILI